MEAAALLPALQILDFLATCREPVAYYLCFVTALKCTCGPAATRTFPSLLPGRFQKNNDTFYEKGKLFRGCSEVLPGLFRGCSDLYKGRKKVGTTPTEGEDNAMAFRFGQKLRLLS